MEYNADCRSALCKICKLFGKSLERTGGVLTTKPFANWKKAVQKMRHHAGSDQHSLASQAAMANQSVSVIQQLHNVAGKERKINRDEVKSFVRSSHFLAGQHIAHTTNFEKLVELVVSCGGEDRKNFLEMTGKNAVSPSHVAVVEFMDALGTWVEESLLKRFRQDS